MYCAQSRVTAEFLCLEQMCCAWMQFHPCSPVTELSYNSALSRDLMNEIASTRSKYSGSHQNNSAVTRLND